MQNNTYTIEVRSIDWVVILTRLLAKHNPKSGNDVTIVIAPDGRNTVYQIRRDFVTPEELAAVIGTTADKIALAERIILTPLVTETVWQTPTVDYIGTA
jgi:hypothetical protein